MGVKFSPAENPVLEKTVLPLTPACSGGELKLLLKSRAGCSITVKSYL
jgi:hypothetical protein